jgi:hypothetical protein
MNVAHRNLVSIPANILHWEKSVLVAGVSYRDFAYTALLPRLSAIGLC